MKLMTRAVGGFMLVAILPLVLMSLLLYLYVDSSFESFALQRSDLAVHGFRFFLAEKLDQMERDVQRVTTERDFLIKLLSDQSDPATLRDKLEEQIHAGRYDFALLFDEDFTRKADACRPELRQLIEDYRLTARIEHHQVSGLVKLSGSGNDRIAAVVLMPVFFQGDNVGYLLVGRTLDQLIAYFQMSLHGLSGLIISSDRKVLAVRADSLIAAALPEIDQIETGDGAFRVQIADMDYFVRQTHFVDISGEEIGEVRYIFDLGELGTSRSSLFQIFLLLALSAIAFSLLVGVLYARSLSKPVVEMSTAARKIAAGEVPQRIHYFHDDEIGHLVEGINKLTDDLGETTLRLRRTEQVAAWQMFARQTAHEMKNFLMPLATMSAQIQRWAETGEVGGERLKEAVGNIQGEIVRMKRMLAAFSEFAKLPPPEIKPVAVAAIVEDIKAAFPLQIESGAIHLVVDSSVGNVFCDRDQIRQVLLNLLTNSFHAQSTLVEITIKATEKQTTFEVADDGCGIDPTKGVDPFAPLYTTKRSGSGLGLAIVKRIIVDHGGDISYHPNPAGGTLFKFYLSVKQK